MYVSHDTNSFLSRLGIRCCARPRLHAAVRVSTARVVLLAGGLRCWHLRSGLTPVALQIALHVFGMRLNRGAAGVTADAFGDLVELQPVGDDPRLAGRARELQSRKKRLGLVNDRAEGLQELKRVARFDDVE